MATLALSSIGAAVGGPLGSAIGGLVGRQIDRSLSGGRSARIRDLRVQRSQYGESIPAVYGRMRVAGTVIWATEAKPAVSVTTSSSRPTYTASFAVAVSSRQVRSIERIWADSRLVRGSTGDHKISFALRIHDGGEDQLPDPLISSIEGADRAPAFRGLCIAVFENFDLSSFGNRVPQFTFEINAGDQTRLADQIIADVLGVRALPSSMAPVVSGFELEGDTVADAIHPLLELDGRMLRVSDAGWECSAAEQSEPKQSLPLGELEAAAVEFEENAADEASLPTRISLRYFAAKNDFAVGEQSARLPGPERVRRIEFAGSLAGSEARRLTQEALARAWYARRQLSIKLPIAWLTKIKLGDVVTGERQYHVVEMRVQNECLQVQLAPIDTRLANEPAADGRVVRELDRPPAPLVLQMLEVPPSLTAMFGSVSVAVCGDVTPWRPPGIAVRYADRTITPSRLAGPSVLGRLVDLMPAGAQSSFDEETVVDVALEVDEVLQGASDAALSAGANLAWVDGEIIQFGISEYLGSGRYRLRHLLRGRHGSSATQHAVGSPFVMLVPDRLASVRIPPEMAGVSVEAIAEAVSGSQVRQALAFTGGVPRA